MHFSKANILSALAASALASPITSDFHQGEVIRSNVEKREVAMRAAAVSCVPAVVFAVRGSDPTHNTLDYNPNYSQLPSGMTAAANAVISKNGGTLSTGLRPVSYPAINPSVENLQNGNYQKSIDQGVTTLQQSIIDYVNACPSGKIFVMGYSQGAQVAGSALGGNQSHPPLRVHGRVTAAVLYADPTYIDGLSPIDQGSGANNGRNGKAAGNGDKQRYLNTYFAGRLQSYCQAGDEFCDSGTGSDAGYIHGDCPQYFQSQAIAFLTSF